MTRSLKSLWGRFLFRDRGITPSNRYIFLNVCVTIFLIILGFWGIPWIIVILTNVIIIFTSLLELLFLPRNRELAIKRSITDEMERGAYYSITLEVQNNSTFPAHFRIIDGIPQSFRRPFPLNGYVEKEERAVITYQTAAPIRGEYHVKKLFLRYRTKLGFWEKQTLFTVKDTLKVIPDLTETKHYLENAQKFLNYEGVHIRKQKSGVGEFSQIRSYVVGDDPRKINWRQTAKLQEVMTNEYEPEHGKYITILIDCGRMMGAELKNGNRLEKSMEAALTVAAAALQKGDYVAVIAFSKSVKAFVPPAKGLPHLQIILKAIYNLKVDAAESNYGEVLHYLQLVQKKRSLLLLFSDVRTFLHEESALIYLKRLRQRHLFFMIGIEDETMAKRIKGEPSTVEDAMIKSMAQQQALFKKREKAKWEKQGLLMVEAKEEKLATAAVSYYIDLVNRGLL